MATRVVYDKRSLRRQYGAAFAAAIAEQRRPGASFLDEVAAACGGGGASPAACDGGGGGVAVLARKRSLFAEEAAAGEFDAVEAAPHGLVVHVARMRPDLRTPFLAAHYSPLYALAEEASDADLVASVRLDETLAAVAGGGADAAVCCFGQTGSGKTHTMRALLAAAGELLLGGKGGGGGGDGGGGGGLVARRGLVARVAAYEVAGAAARDLLSGDGRRLRVREDATGRVCIDAARVQVRTPAELAAVVAAAARARRTAATARNPGSSRSHAFYDVRLEPLGAGAVQAADGCAAGSQSCGGVLFVDLAGSERAADALRHDAALARQSADIHSGLSALKECFRLRSAAAAAVAGVTAGCANRELPPPLSPPPVPRAPFRESTLTRLLQNVLAVPPGGSGAARQPRVTVIATVSPAASDAEATLDTLRHAAAMAGVPLGRGGADADADTLLGVAPVANARPGPARVTAGADGRPLPSLRARRERCGAAGGAEEVPWPSPPCQQQQQQQHQQQQRAATQAVATAAAAVPASRAPAARAPLVTARSSRPGARRGGVAASSRPAVPLPERSFPDGGGGGAHDQNEAARAWAQGGSGSGGGGGGGAAKRTTPRGAPPPPRDDSPLLAPPPAKWTAAEARRWVATVDGGRFRAAAAALPAAVDGRALARFPEHRFKQLFGADEAAARRGRALFARLRAELRAGRERRLAAAREAAAGMAATDGAAAPHGRGLW